MALIDPHLSDEDAIARSAALSKKAIHRDKDRATAFDRQVLFSSGGCYAGTPEQVARLAARSGKQVQTPKMLAERLEAQSVADGLLPED